MSVARTSVITATCRCGNWWEGGAQRRNGTDVTQRKELSGDISIQEGAYKICSSTKARRLYNNEKKEATPQAMR